MSNQNVHISYKRIYYLKRNERGENKIGIIVLLDVPSILSGIVVNGEDRTIFPSLS